MAASVQTESRENDKLVNCENAKPTDQPPTNVTQLQQRGAAMQNGTEKPAAPGRPMSTEPPALPPQLHYETGADDSSTIASSGMQPSFSKAPFTQHYAQQQHRFNTTTQPPTPTLNQLLQAGNPTANLAAAAQRFHHHINHYEQPQSPYGSSPQPPWMSNNQKFVSPAYRNQSSGMSPSYGGGAGSGPGSGSSSSIEVGSSLPSPGYGDVRSTTGWPGPPPSSTSSGLSQLEPDSPSTTTANNSSASVSQSSVATPTNQLSPQSSPISHSPGPALSPNSQQPPQQQSAASQHHVFANINRPAPPTTPNLHGPDAADLSGGNSNDSCSGPAPGTPNSQSMRPTPSPTGSTGSRSMSPAVGQQNIPMPPRPSSSQSDGQPAASPRISNSPMSSVPSSVNQQNATVSTMGSSMSSMSNYTVQSHQHHAPYKGNHPNLHVHPSASNMIPSSHIHHPHQQQIPATQAMYQHHPYSQHLTYPPRPQYVNQSYGGGGAGALSPNPAASNATNNTNSTQYPSNRRSPNSHLMSTSTVPHNSQYSPYHPHNQQQHMTWQPPPPSSSKSTSGTNDPTPPPASPGSSGNVCIGAASSGVGNTVSSSSSPSRSPHYLKQHLQHKMASFGNNIGSGSSNCATGHLPPSNSPPHAFHMSGPMGPPHSAAISATMGPPQHPSGMLSHAHSIHDAGMGPMPPPPNALHLQQSLMSSNNEQNSGAMTPMDNGILGGGGLTVGPQLNNVSVTSVITTGPDGTPIDDGSQQSTLSNASAASGEDPQCPASKIGRKNDLSHYSSHPSTPQNTVPSPGAISMNSLHEDYGELSSPSWPRTPASPVFNSHVHPPEVFRSKKTDSLGKLYDMDDSPDRRIWLDKLLAFMEDRRTPITTCPTISKNPLDLFRLYLFVKDRGGFMEVTKNKTWKDIAGMLGIGASSSAAYTLRKHYTKNLLAYECQFDRGGIDPQPIINQVEATTKKKSSKAASVPSPGSSNSQESFPSGPGSSSVSGSVGIDVAVSSGYNYGSYGNTSADYSSTTAPSTSRPSSQTSATSPHSGMFLPPMNNTLGSSSDSNNVSISNPFDDISTNPPPTQMVVRQGGPFATYQSAPANRPASQGTGISMGVSGYSGQGAPNSNQSSTGYGYSAAQNLSNSSTAQSDQYSNQFQNNNSAYPNRPSLHYSSAYGGGGGPVNAQPGAVSGSLHTSNLPTSDQTPNTGSNSPSMGPCLNTNTTQTSNNTPDSYGRCNTNSSGSNSQYGPPRLAPSPSGVVNQQQQSPAGTNSQSTGPNSTSVTTTSTQQQLLSNQYGSSAQQTQEYYRSDQYGAQQPGTPNTFMGTNAMKTMPPPSGPQTPRRHPDFTKDQQPQSSFSSQFSGAQQRPQAYSGWTNSNSNASNNLNNNQYRPPQYTAGGTTGSIASAGINSPQWSQNSPNRPSIGNQWDRYPTSNTSQGFPVNQQSSVISTQQQGLNQPNVTQWSSTPGRPSPAVVNSSSRSVGKGFMSSGKNSANLPTGSLGGASLSTTSSTTTAVPPGSGVIHSTAPFGSPQISAHHMPKRDIVFPPDSVEATLPFLYRRKRLNRSDLGLVDPWRIILCLRSGLLSESTYAIDVLNTLLFDDSTVCYFGLTQWPGLLDLLLEHFQKALSDVFDGNFSCDLPATCDSTRQQYHTNSDAAKPPFANVRECWYHPGYEVEPVSEIRRDYESGGKHVVDLGAIDTPIDPALKTTKLHNTNNFTMMTRKGYPVRIADDTDDLFIKDNARKWDVRGDYSREAIMRAPVVADPWTKSKDDHIISAFQAEFGIVPFFRYVRKSDKTSCDVRSPTPVPCDVTVKEEDSNKNERDSESTDADSDANTYSNKNNAPEQIESNSMDSEEMEENSQESQDNLKVTQDHNELCDDSAKDNSISNFFNEDTNSEPTCRTRNISDVISRINFKENDSLNSDGGNTSGCKTAKSELTVADHARVPNECDDGQNSNIKTELVMVLNNDLVNTKDSSNSSDGDCRTDGSFSKEDSQEHRIDVKSEKKAPNSKVLFENKLNLDNNSMDESECKPTFSLRVKRRRLSDYEDEAYNRDEASLVLITESQDNVGKRCVCISNIIRSLTFIPGNELEFSKNITYLAIVGKLLLLNHEHPAKAQKTRNYDREEDADFSDSCSSLQGETEWWWDYLALIRENVLVSIANISGQIDFSQYAEAICRPILDGLLHWAICPSASGQDPFATVGPTSMLSPQRLALEALCKLCVTNNNVDLVIATPPFVRLERLCAVLTKHLCRSEDQVLREFSINLLHYLAAADSCMARTVATQSPCVSLLVAFIEQAEQIAMGVANQHGIGALRDNPDSIGTSLDMLRRAAATLVSLARHPDNRALLIQQESRLLALVMSQILNQEVALLLSKVLYQISRT